MLHAPFQLPTIGTVDCLATAGPPATDAEATVAATAAAAAAAAGAGAGAATDAGAASLTDEIPESEGDDIGDVISHHRGEDVAPAD